MDEALRSEGFGPEPLAVERELAPVSVEHAAAERKARLETIKGDALLKELQADHWFWQWGNESWREDFRVPKGLVDPDAFYNVETQELKSFLDELHRDGVELMPDPDDPDHFLMDRTKFMEWVILRYVRDTPTFTKAELEAYATGKVEEARAAWEDETEEERIEHGEELEKAELESKAARSGWIPLTTIAKHTGVDGDELFKQLSGRYTLGLLHSRSTRWAAKWPDAFEWMREHFEGHWDSNSEEARESIGYLVGRGIDETMATDKVRRAFANEQAALPISRRVGVHTLTDREHLLEGHQILGFDRAGESITESNDWPWAPYGEKEAEAGFPIWGDVRDY